MQLRAVIRACGDPAVARRAHGWLTLAWIVMMPTSIAFGWIYLTAFVSVVSIYANGVGHWSAWQAARVEEKQADQADEVVEAITEQTEVNRSDVPSRGGGSSLRGDR